MYLAITFIYITYFAILHVLYMPYMDLWLYKVYYGTCVYIIHYMCKPIGGDIMQKVYISICSVPRNASS